MSDMEALRRKWREKQRRRVERFRAIHGTEALRAKWREQARRRTHTYTYTPHPRQPKTVPCRYCLTPFAPGRHQPGEGRVFCGAACRKLAGLVGANCSIRITDCDVCGRPFTIHGTPQKRCSDDCRLTAKRTAMRDYQRRTHGVAIKYWTLDDSPAARDVARLYFELRTDLRNRRAG